MTPATTIDRGMLPSRQTAASVTARRWFACSGAILALTAAWIWPLRDWASDLFAAHMFQHLLAMNVAAPLFAMALPRHLHKMNAAQGEKPLARAAASLPIVTGLQLTLLYFWHLPDPFVAAHHNAALQVLMQVSLFAAALLFWRAILRQPEGRVWAPIFALLMTAKVFCLLGAAFIFSRRALYPMTGDSGRWGLTALEDLQLAGLTMVSACALVYVTAGIALFARWMFAAPSREKSPLCDRSDAAPIGS